MIIISFIATILVFVGLVLFFWKAKRRMAWGLLGLGMLGFVLAGALGSSSLDADAQKAGFANHADFKMAATYNIENPEIWKDMQAKLIAEHGEVISAEERDRRQKGFHCLSKFDGRHEAFTEEFLKSLRDPESFEHISTKVTPASGQGRHQLYMDYRAKNGFGGMNAGTARGYYDTKTCEHVLLALE